MAELVLAIIPLGITVTSGLVKYLNAFNDHDIDHVRLVRQAGRFASTFKSLEVALKRSLLTPELSTTASEASICLDECQKALEELDTLQQKIFAAATNTASTTHHARTKDKVKGGYKRLIYPLRKSDMETLEGALNKLSATLTLVLGMLHLDEEFLIKDTLNGQMAEIQKNTIVSSNTSIAVKELRQPISRIDLAVPALQTSVDSIVPYIDQRFDQISYQYVQMQAQIESLLDMAGTTLETNQQFSRNQSGQQISYFATHETEKGILTLAKRADSVSICSCPSLRVRQSKGFGLGPVQFFEEILFNHGHEKSCVFFVPSTDYEKMRTIRFTGLASLLKKGIEVSFSTRARPGAFSICPSLTYFPVVKLSRAPAFILFLFLRDVYKLKNMDEKRCRTVLRVVERKLRELFISGRASPNDVTQYNHTLLHFLSITAWAWLRTLRAANSPFVRLTCESLVNFLVAAGTPVTVRDSNGKLALHSFIAGAFVPASIYGQLITGNDEEDRSNLSMVYAPNMRGLVDYYENNQSLARIQYGPLSLAIIQNNLPEVERLISLYPHMLKEVNSYGETPLHIAIYRPDILKALAKKANPEDWIELTNGLATVLNLAILVSHEICNPGETLDASCCPCTLPLRVILAAGCPIIPYRDFSRSYYSMSEAEGSFSEASLHCKTLVAKELRSRRWQLQDLARNNFSITELSNFTHLDEVPDIDAIKMDRLLREKGVRGLGPFSSFVEGDLHRQPQQNARCYSRSIFFDLRNSGDADLFFDSGFKIICADEDHASSLDRAFFTWTHRIVRSISLDYAIWLFEHQAPLWKWSFRFTRPMPSAFVLAEILGIQGYKYVSRVKTSDKAEHYLCESVLVDNCICLCSPDGCTPFASRMKWLAHPYKRSRCHTPREIATKFGFYVEIYGKRLNISHHVIMVRQATFAALELKHTCFDRPAYAYQPYNPRSIHWIDPMTEMEPDEIEFEILNVDVEVRNQLENVVAMFQDFVLTGDQTTVSAETDSCDIDFSVSGEPSVVGTADLYYQRVLEFWQHIWINRIQDALNAVARAWDSRLDGIHDLVQISTCEEAVQETRDSLEEGDDDEIFNRIIQQIQDL